MGTKLRPAASSRGYRERPRISRLLDRGLDDGTRLTLLSAPPGYGKTDEVIAAFAGPPLDPDAPGTRRTRGSSLWRDDAGNLIEALTPRELDVLRLMARGASNAEIAAGLAVSVGTARWHVGNVMAKLGVRSRTQGGVARGRIARGLAAPREVNALLLTTRGRRSGRERTVVLQFFPDGDAMIVTAANAGATSHPGWHFNLRDDPPRGSR